MKRLAIVAEAALITVMTAGCAGATTHTLASTVTQTVTAPVTVTVTASAAPAGGLPSSSAEPSKPVAFKYGPRGAYAVGETRGGLTQAIPPGRYRIEGVNGQGFLKQCSTVVCDMSNTDDLIDTTITESGAPTIVEIAGSVTAIYLFDTTATPLE
jgi:hypothetical protein